MTRQYTNFIEGTVDTQLEVAGTTLSGAILASLPQIADPDIAILVLDPEAINNGPEIVHVTAHTSSATTATIVRAQESTSDVVHPVNTVIQHGPTAAVPTDIESRVDTAETKLAGIETGAAADQTINAGSGLTGGGSGDPTLAHADTSSVANTTNAPGTVVEDLAFDDFGHVTAVTSRDLDPGDIGAQPAITNIRADGISGGHIVLAVPADLTGVDQTLLSKAITRPTGWASSLCIVQANIQYHSAAAGAYINAKINIDTDVGSLIASAPALAGGAVTVAPVASTITTQASIDFTVKAYELGGDTGTGRYVTVIWFLLRTS